MSAAPATTIALFPLGTVLLPGGLLPLKIFEQRYLEMTKRCIAEDAPFGVCLISEGAEVGAPAAHHAIGCTARIAQWDMPHPGLFTLRAVGERRFRATNTRADALGLASGEIELLDELSTDAPPRPRQRSLIETVIARHGADIFAQAPRLDDAVWIGYRLAELLPLPPAVRLEALLADSATALADLIDNLLDQAGIAA